MHINPNKLASLLILAYAVLLLVFGLHFKAYNFTNLPVVSKRSGLSFPVFSHALVEIPMQATPKSAEDILYIRFGLNEFRAQTNEQFQVLASFQMQENGYFLIIGQWNEYLIFRKDENFSSSDGALVFNMRPFVTDDILEIEIQFLHANMTLSVDGKAVISFGNVDFPMPDDTLMTYLGGVPGKTNSWGAGIREFELGRCTANLKEYSVNGFVCESRNSLAKLDFISGIKMDRMDLSENSLAIDLNPAFKVDKSKFLTVSVPDGFISKNYMIDLVVNIWGFVPFGFLMVHFLRIRRKSDIAVESKVILNSVLIAVVAGSSISFFIETVQLLIPSRVSSLHDLIYNSVGTLLGALAYAFICRLSADDSLRSH